MIFSGNYNEMCKKGPAMMLLVVFILILIAISILISTIKNGISPMPTSPKVRGVFLASLPRTAPDHIAELGAGFGTLAFAIAHKYPDSTVVAYENSIIPFLFMKLRKFISKTPNLEITYKDFFRQNLTSYSLIVCYLYPGAMNKLEEKFEKELLPQASIYTHTFAVPHWKPKETWQVNDFYRTTIYHYVKM
jgi:hypothetical protein